MIRAQSAVALLLVRELARRGYSESDLEKILGGNVLRVMRQVEDVARRMQSGRM